MLYQVNMRRNPLMAELTTTPKDDLRCQKPL